MTEYGENQRKSKCLLKGATNELYHSTTDIVGEQQTGNEFVQQTKSEEPIPQVTNSYYIKEERMVRRIIDYLDISNHG